MLNKPKVMGNSTSIYITCAPNSKKFLKKLIIYIWPMFVHVRLYVNYEWTNIQLKMNLYLIKSELRIN
jgi:hypothetical protein